MRAADIGEHGTRTHQPWARIILKVMKQNDSQNTCAGEIYGVLYLLKCLQNKVKIDYDVKKKENSFFHRL